VAFDLAAEKAEMEKLEERMRSRIDIVARSRSLESASLCRGFVMSLLATKL